MIDSRSSLIRIFRFVILMVALALGTSCIKEQLELEYSKQEEQIDKYITGELSKNEDWSVTHNKGSNRMTMVAGEGTPLSAEGTVSFRYAAYIFNGSMSPNNLVATNDQGTAIKTGWQLSGSDFSLYTVSLKEKNLLKGLKYGLEGVQKGEECQILFSGKYGTGNKRNNVIPKNTALLYHIWVEDVVE